MARKISITVTNTEFYDSKDSRSMTIECPNEMELADMRELFNQLVVQFEKIREDLEPKLLARFAKAVELV